MKSETKFWSFITNFIRSFIRNCITNFIRSFIRIFLKNCIKIFITSFSVCFLFLDSVWAIQDPPFCLEKQKYPCAFYLKKPSLVKIESTHFYGSAQAQIFLLDPQKSVLLEGKVLISSSEEKRSWHVYGYEVRTEGKALLIKHPHEESYTWIQLSDQGYVTSSIISKASSSRVTSSSVRPFPVKTTKSVVTLFPGQKVQFHRNQVSIPQVLWKPLLFSYLEGFSPEVGNLLQSLIQKPWIASATMGIVYREVAQSVLDEKDGERLKRLEKRRREEEKNLKYKEAFRKRYQSPEAWSEFIQNPDLSP
jgi:hypothetical protein